MRVRDLRSALEEIGGIFQDARAKAHLKDIEALLELLEGKEDQDLGGFLDDLRKVLDPNCVDDVLVSRHIQQLTEAGTNETAFNGALKVLGSDDQIRKQELVLIAQRYLGKRRRIKARDSSKKILETLKAHFDEIRYEKESRNLARRATPV